MTDPVQHVRLERVAVLQIGVIEVAGLILLHTDCLHDLLRRLIIDRGKRHDLLQLQGSKPQPSAVQAASLAKPSPQWS